MTRLSQVRARVEFAHDPAVDITDSWVDAADDRRFLLGLVDELAAALKYCSCSGKDDGDFYAHEDIASVAIRAANHARAALARLKE